MTTMNFKSALVAMSLAALALSAAPSAAQTSSSTGRGGGAGGESGASTATPAQQGRGAANQRMNSMDNSGMMSPRSSYQDPNYGASEAGTGGGAGGESGSGSSSQGQAGTRE